MKNFVEPQVVILKLDIEDVVTTSGGTGTGGTPTTGGEGGRT